jgi:molecular chaperone DnaK (HSP70)
VGHFTLAKNLRDAGTIAGLNVRLLDEPVAAAISICLNNLNNTTTRDIEQRNPSLLICNFGAGTFDVSSKSRQLLVMAILGV